MFRSLPLALVVLTAIVALALFLLNADQMFMVGSLRYKLTATVQVDDRVVTASTIQEVGYFDMPAWMLTPTREDIRVRGSALTVDLGSVGSLVFRHTLGFKLPEACAVTRGDGVSLSAWYQQQRARLPLCAGLRASFAREPQVLLAPPYAEPFPATLIPNPGVGSSIAPGFKTVKGSELSGATQGRVKLLAIQDEVTEEPLTLLPSVKWLQPLIDGAISSFAAPNSSGGFATFQAKDFAQDTFH